MSSSSTSTARPTTAPGRDLILRVFLKVLNELQGYSGDHPHIAHMERYLEGKGKLEAFQDAYREAHRHRLGRRSGTPTSSTGMRSSRPWPKRSARARTSAEKWIDGAEDNFSLTVENFCKWVKEYLDSKGPQHRLVFLVDEVGQFIGTDSHLMLNLQTITEELGTICRRRAWVVVTSQEDMDAVLGDMSKAKKQGLLEDPGPLLYPPLSLSSANVDEVIQSRLLAKLPDVKAELEAVFSEKGDILKNQLTFKNCGMTFRQFKDGDDFVKNYPFAPYQFQLIQKIFEAIRKAGATGHAPGPWRAVDARRLPVGGEGGARSTRSASWCRSTTSTRPSRASSIRRSRRPSTRPETNPSLEPFDIQLLQVLFLIRYVEEMKGNVDNLVTLCLDQIDGDRLALRRRIEESLGRLEKETLISRSGDELLLPDQRRAGHQQGDQDRSISSSGEEAKLLGEIIFEDVLKGQRKHRYQRQQDGLRLQPPLRPATRSATRGTGRCSSRSSRRWPTTTSSTTRRKCILESGTEGGHVLIRLGNDESLGRELRTYLQTEKYLSAQERRHAVRIDQAHPAGLRRGQPAAARAADDAARRDARRGRILTSPASRSSSRRRRRWRRWTRPWSTSSRTRSARWATSSACASRAAEGDPGGPPAATTSPRRHLLFRPGREQPARRSKTCATTCDSARRRASRSSCTT